MADTSKFTYQIEGEHATMDDYAYAMSDRPYKFSAEQVMYSPSPKFTQTCHNCVHLFRSAVSKRITCEIFRPADDNNVSPAGFCAYFTDDYRTFPLLHILTDKET